MGDHLLGGDALRVAAEEQQTEEHDQKTRNSGKHDPGQSPAECQTMIRSLMPPLEALLVEFVLSPILSVGEFKGLRLQRDAFLFSRIPEFFDLQVLANLEGGSCQVHDRVPIRHRI